MKKKREVTQGALDAMRSELEGKGVDTSTLTAADIVKLHDKHCQSKEKKELTPYQIADRHLASQRGIRAIFKKVKKGAIKVTNKVDGTVAGWLERDDEDETIVIVD